MENTLENKAKFIALYWGQKIVSFNEENLVTRGEVTPQKLNAVNISYPAVKYCVLELTPLSQITDEDAYNAGITKARLKNHINHPHIMTPFMCDYLRSKGYALPWMGLSVEQLVSFGWVKLKEA